MTQDAATEAVYGYESPLHSYSLFFVLFGSIVAMVRVEGVEEAVATQ